jgi:hypothetical protein
MFERGVALSENVTADWCSQMKNSSVLHAKQLNFMLINDFYQFCFL